jgi:asparagine synthase (glutamine-hydrolysing)
LCGINGVLDYTGIVTKSTIKLMNDELAHRGPDGEGVYADAPILLGHRRLSIIDLSTKANQPMVSQDGSMSIVFNGEIYNYKELMTSLKREGVVFGSTSDT